MRQNVFLIVTSAFVLAGDIAKPGELVEVSDSEAREFLRRGMARVATEDDGVPAATANEQEPEAEQAAEPEAAEVLDDQPKAKAKK